MTGPVSIQAAPPIVVLSPQTALIPLVSGRIFEMTGPPVRLGYLLRPTASGTGDGLEVDTC